MKRAHSPNLYVSQYNSVGELIHEDCILVEGTHKSGSGENGSVSKAGQNLGLSMHEKAIASLAALSYRSGELDDYLRHICQAVLDVLGDGAAAVTLYRNGKKNVLARVPHSPKVGVPLDVHGQLSTFVVESGEILRVKDALANPQYGNPPAGYCSYLGIPLKLPNGKIVGTLCYFDECTREYGDEDAQVASLFAERVAIALDNYELYLQLKDHSENLEALIEQRTRELLAARDKIAHQEKLAAIGEFATRLTHEIRNPLATIRLALEYVERQSDERAGKRASLASSEVSRLERMLNEVLVYARPANLNRQPIHLADFVDAFLSTHEHLFEPKQVRVVLHKPSNPVVWADPDKLNQILLNLITNALDAVDPQQAIECTITESAQWGRLQIQNGGAVIPPEKLDQITEAFVSGKPNGSGLGLAIIKSLVEVHQGELAIESNPSTGTVVSVSLPKHGD